MASHIDPAAISQFVQHINESKDPSVSAKVFADFLEEHGNHLAQALREHRHNASGVKADYNHSLHLQSPHMTTFIAPATGDHEGDFVVETGVQGSSASHWLRSRQSRRDVDKIVDRVKQATSDHNDDISHFYSSLGMEEPGSEEIETKEKMNRRKKNLIKFSRWVDEKEIGNFDTSNDGGKAAVSDFLQEQGDPRHIFINKEDDHIDYYNRTHSDDVLHKFSLEKQIIPNKSGKRIELRVNRYAPNYNPDESLKKDKRFTKSPVLKVSLKIGHKSNLFRGDKFMNPEDVYDWIHTFPGGPPKKIKSFLEDSFPHLKGEEGKEKMNRRKRSKVKFSRWVSDEEIKPFSANIEDIIEKYSDPSFLTGEEFNNRSEDYTDGIERHKSIIADLLEENGDPRHYIVRDGNFHTHRYVADVYNNFLGNYEDSHNFQGSHHVLGETGSPLLSMSAAFPIDKTKPKSVLAYTKVPGVLQGKSLDGVHDSVFRVMSPQDAHDMASSIPDSEESAKAKTFLEGHFPELKQPIVEKMNRNKRSKVKFSRWLGHDDIAPFEQSKDEDEKNLPGEYGYDSEERSQLKNKHDAILADFFQEYDDPRYHLTSPHKGVDGRIANMTHLDYDYSTQRPEPFRGTIDRGDGSKLSVYVTPKYFSEAFAKSHGITNPEHTGPLFSVMTVDRQSKNGLTILHHKHLKLDEAHDFVADMPNGPHKEAFQKYLDEHFPLPKEPQPEKMGRRNRSKVKFARWVDYSEIKPFHDKLQSEWDDIVNGGGATGQGFHDIKNKHKHVISDLLQENGDPRYHLVSPSKGISDGLANTAYSRGTNEEEKYGSIEKEIGKEHGGAVLIKMHVKQFNPASAKLFGVANTEYKGPVVYTEATDYPSSGSDPLYHYKHLKPEEAHDFVDDIPDGLEKEELKSYLNRHFPRSESSPDKMNRGNSAWRVLYQRAINNIAVRKKEAEKLKKQKAIRNLIRFFRNK